MNNRNLSRNADNAKDIVQGVIDDLIREIEDLEEIIDKQADEITTLKQQIDNHAS